MDVSEAICSEVNARLLADAEAISLVGVDPELIDPNTGSPSPAFYQASETATDAVFPKLCFRVCDSTRDTKFRQSERGNYYLDFDYWTDQPGSDQVKQMRAVLLRLFDTQEEEGALPLDLSSWDPVCFCWDCYEYVAKVAEHDPKRHLNFGLVRYLVAAGRG